MLYIFSEVVETVEDKSDFVMSSPLMHIESFLLALTNADKDGRIVINKQSNVLHKLACLFLRKVKQL